MSLEERLDAVERTVTDDDRGPADLSESAEREARIDAVEGRLDDLDSRVAELEAATQALRGYAGNVRSVDREVERTAESALAIAERVERRLDDAPSELRRAWLPDPEPPDETEDHPGESDADSSESDVDLLNRLRDAL